MAVLLPKLRERFSGWVVLKNHEDLPRVSGDIDLCVDRSDWDAFVAHLAALMSKLGGATIVSCDHYVGVRLIFTISNDPSLNDSVLEIDLADGVWWKGHQLLEAREAIQFGTDDPRGFRCASPATEAAYHLTIEAVGRFGRLRPNARHFQRIQELAEQDGKAFREVMRQMHGAIGERAADRFVRGTWNPLDGILLSLRRSGRGPLGLYRRAVQWVRRKRVRHWKGLPRETPRGVDEWLARVGYGHVVQKTGLTNS